MKLNRPSDVYRQLYIELTSHKERKINMQAAIYNLDDLFRKGVDPENYKGLCKTMK